MSPTHRAADSRKPWLGNAVQLMLLMVLLIPLGLAVIVFGALGVVTLLLGG